MIEDNMTHDEGDWGALFMDMPFGFPAGLSRHEALLTPGCAVKSKERAAIGWPKYHGRVLKNEQDEAIVIAHRGTHPYSFGEGTKFSSKSIGLVIKMRLVCFL